MNYLTLYTINEGQTYESRLAAARTEAPGVKALRFVQIANFHAARYAEKYLEVVDPRTRLEAALELMDYYDDHLREIEESKR